MNKYLLKIKNQFYRFLYPLIYLKAKNIHTLNVDNSMDKLIKNGKSLSRFGDGELQWILKSNENSFEKNSDLLRKRLLEVLNSTDSNLAISLPVIFYGSEGLTSRSKRFYRLFMVEKGYKCVKYLNVNREYYNTNITRLYMGYKDKKNADERFSRLSQLWNNKNILIVEGNQTHLGVNNDLFSNAKSISRIECPAVNAFESYDQIFSSVSSYLKHHKEQNILTLIALGPTATVLAANISNIGYRAIDIGHVDVEYEWYLMGAKKETNIPDRYVNELNEEGKETIPVSNKQYDQQIVDKII